MNTRPDPDEWHNPERQAARDVQRLAWARGVLADPAPHSPARLRRARLWLAELTPQERTAP